MPLRYTPMTQTFRRALQLALLCSPLFVASAAHAYIGPGMASGAIATVLGVLAGILMLVVGAVWYPIKRLVQRLKRKP